MANNKFDFVDVVRELEHVDLSPLLLPALKIIDPIALAIPEGMIKEYLSHLKPRDGQFDFLAKVAPALPGAIKVIGKIAAFKPVGIVFGAVAEVLSQVLKVAIPAGVAAFKVIKPVAGLGVNAAKGVLAK